MIISHSVLLRMRNVSDKNCTENQNTHFVFCNISPPPRKPCRFWDNVEKYGTSRPATDDNTAERSNPQMITRRMRFGCRITETTNTLSEYAILIAFSHKTVVTRTRLNVPLYVHCLLLLPCCGSSGLLSNRSIKFNLTGLYG